MNTRPLSVGARATLLKIISAQLNKGHFPANDKNLTTVHGREVDIPLIDENVTPIACKHQRHNPVHADVIIMQVDKWKEMGIVDYSDWRKSKWFTLLDLPQAYDQIPIKLSDRHKTAFRDARGRLHQFTRCGFGLTTIPAVFSAHLGDRLRPVESKGCVERWLDDILIHTEALEEHFKMLEEVLDLLQKDNYSVHFHKSLFLHGRSGVPRRHGGQVGCSPPPVQDHATDGDGEPTTVGALRSVIRMTNFMRYFVEGFRTKITPLSDILRNKQCSTKQARKKPIPWGKAQDDAFDAIIRALVSPPVLLLPDWNLPFTLHTDASEIAAGAALTQEVEHRDVVIGYGSKRWKPAEARHAPTIRPPVDTSFPDDNTSPGDRTHEPTGPVFDGIPLRDVPTKSAIVTSPEPDLPLAVLWALQHSPAPLDPMDHHSIRAHEEVCHTLSPRHPRAVILGCGAGGAMLALRDVLQVHTAIDPDWTALECARANSWSQDVTLVRVPLAKNGEAVAEAKPENLVGNAFSVFDPQCIGNTATSQEEDITNVFSACRATVLILECPITDFGLSGSSGAGLAGLTKEYAAPEAVATFGRPEMPRQATLQPSLDAYSFGVVMLQLLYVEEKSRFNNELDDPTGGVK
eukprot:g5853.t1